MTSELDDKYGYKGDKTCVVIGPDRLRPGRTIVQWLSECSSYVPMSVDLSEDEFYSMEDVARTQTRPKCKAERLYAEKHAFRMGVEYAKKGATRKNCAFSIFQTPECSRQWDLGRESVVTKSG